MAHFMRDIGPTLVAAGWPFVPIMPPTAETGQYASPKTRKDVEKGRGKAPGMASGGGWKLMFGWQSVGVPGIHKADAWGRMPECGIGIVCGVGNVPVLGVDIDVRDAGAAAELEALALDMLGPAPRRIGAAPKLMLVYRTAEGLPKIKTSLYAFPGDAPDAKDHAVETMAKGQQFVAYGIHPGTGQQYHWSRGEPALMGPGDLTLVTPELIAAYMIAAEEVMERHGAVLKDKNAKKGVVQVPRVARKGGKAGSARSPNATLAEVEEWLAHIPNVDLHYDDWVRIGMAIKGAVGEAGRTLFEEWSGRARKNDPDTTVRAWDSFRPECIGAGTLRWKAREGGWVDVAERPAKVPPSWPMPTRSIQEIAATVEAEVAAFLDHVERNPGKLIQVAVIGDCAAGKTRAVIAAATAYSKPLQPGSM